MSTVTRVLPWRRHQRPAAVEVEPILDQYRRFHPRRPTENIVRAYEVSAQAHSGQLRKSGEPYITHPAAVAAICARYGMDEPTIVAALLHDAVEDTGLTLADVEAQFGAVVAALVDGVTKLDRVEFESKEEQHAASIRKMIIAIAKDLRVLVIKLADRLHNMRTIAALPAWKQERTAIETLDVYAPLAHRLGMGEIRQQLEDLCFAALHPKRYAEIDHLVAQRDPEREIYLTQVAEELRSKLAENNILADVVGRPKTIASIYEKMRTKAKAFDEIYDLVGLRVVVDSEKDCYASMGCVHGMWSPVPGRFKDYVAMPKFNLYQSLHSTVIGPQGMPLEVQFRTREMHERAEYGVAAHYAYKEGNTAPAPADGARGSVPDTETWLDQLVDWQKELADPREFMEGLKTDLELEEISVFTPAGDVIHLPVGSTPVDFAYAIHTEVGHRCVGAKIDGRLVPLDSKLSAGATVEIFTSKGENPQPKQDWLKFIASRSAAAKIKQWYSRERREDALESGRDELGKALRKQGLPVQKLARSPVLAEVATELNYTSLDALHSAIGEHHISAESVAAKVAKIVRKAEPGREEVLATPIRRHRRRTPGGTVGVHVEGFDDVMIRIARCCTPVPGDEIMGFVTRGRGVSVHRTDCSNAESLRIGQLERLIDVEWADDSAGTFVALVEVKALDRDRLLQDITQALSDSRVSIITCNTVTSADRVAKMRFEFELGDPSHLDTIVSRLRTIDSVYDAYRVVPGKGGG